MTFDQIKHNLINPYAIYKHQTTIQSLKHNLFTQTTLKKVLTNDEDDKRITWEDLNEECLYKRYKTRSIGYNK